MHANRPAFANDGRLGIEAGKLKKELNDVIEEGKDYNACPCCHYVYA